MQNETKTPERPNGTKFTSLLTAWYETAALTAIIAGVFSAIVCILLIHNYAQGKVTDPLASRQMADLKAQLFREPGNDAIKQQIRSLDLKLRKEYFRRREFSRRGAYLLTGGVALFLVAAGSASAHRRKLPMPTPDQPQELANAAKARWAVGVLASAVAAIALIAMLTDSGTQYPGSAAVTVQEGPDHQPESSSFPSEEEIKNNWPRFRGPGGLGVTFRTNIPASWDGTTGQGVLWKTPIPLPGHNSPIVWNDKVFLTGATEKERAVFCFDADSGKLLWTGTVSNVPGSSPEPPKVSEDTGFAAPTATTDGQRVYAIFANGDVACFDFGGKRIWARNLGPFDSMYGYASSLIMYHNLLLVLLDQGTVEDDLSKLMALEGATGKTVWSTKRPVPNSWATPIVINTGQREEIITSGAPWVIAYEPATGKELWRADCLGGDVAPSPVFGDGLVFATNTYEVLAAIRPGGQGDVTETNIVWTAEDGLPDICSPLAGKELVFVLETYGLLTCYDAKDGTKVWEEDLGEEFNTSPSLVVDKVYLTTVDGVTIIIEAGREYKELGRCKLGEGCRTSPAFADGRIYMSGEENLYCLVNAQKQ